MSEIFSSSMKRVGLGNVVVSAHREATYGSCELADWDSRCLPVRMSLNVEYFVINL